MPLELDHVVVAAPDLAAACQAFTAETGCEPVAGGPHLGLGTRNALVSFGDRVYLEIVAPDPEQPPAANLGATLARLEAPRLFHWALRTDALAALGDRLRTRGIEPTPPLETRRRTPDGRQLAWQLMGLPGRGGAWPFFIDWGDSPHPADSAPVVGALRGLRVALPEDPAALPFRDAAGVELTSGPPGLALRFESARGEVAWQQQAPLGFFG